MIEIRKEIQQAHHVRFGIRLQKNVNIIFNIWLPLDIKLPPIIWNSTLCYNVGCNIIEDFEYKFEEEYPIESSWLDILVTTGWTKQKIMKIIGNEYKANGLIFDNI